MTDLNSFCICNTFRANSLLTSYWFLCIVIIIYSSRRSRFLWAVYWTVMNVARSRDEYIHEDRWTPSVAPTCPRIHIMFSAKHYVLNVYQVCCRPPVQYKNPPATQNAAVVVTRLVMKRITFPFPPQRIFLKGLFFLPFFHKKNENPLL